MKTEETFKFNCGDLVRHKAGERYGSKILIIARGVFYDIHNSSDVMYVCSISNMSGIARAYINEVELELCSTKE